MVYILVRSRFLPPPSLTWFPTSPCKSPGTKVGERSASEMSFGLQALQQCDAVDLKSSDNQGIRDTECW